MIGFQVFLSNTNNSHTVVGFQVVLSNTNNSHTVVGFQIFLSNTNNSHTVVGFQVFLSNTNNSHKVVGFPLLQSNTNNYRVSNDYFSRQGSKLEIVFSKFSAYSLLCQLDASLNPTETVSIVLLLLYQGG